MRRRGAAAMLRQIEAANRMSYRAVEGFMHSGVVRAPPASMHSWHSARNVPWTIMVSDSCSMRRCMSKVDCALAGMRLAAGVKFGVQLASNMTSSNLLCSARTGRFELLCVRAGLGVFCRDVLVCSLEAALRHACRSHSAGGHPGWPPVVDRAAIPARPRLRACSRRGPGKPDQRVATLPYGTTILSVDIVHVQALLYV